MTEITLNAITEGAKVRQRTRVSRFAAVVAAMALATTMLAGGGAAKAGEMDGSQKDVINNAQVAERAQGGRDLKAKARAGKDSFILEMPGGETDGLAFYFPPTVSWSEPDDHVPQIHVPQIRLHPVWSW